MSRMGSEEPASGLQAAAPAAVMRVLGTVPGLPGPQRCKAGALRAVPGAAGVCVFWCVPGFNWTDHLFSLRSRLPAGSTGGGLRRRRGRGCSGPWSVPVCACSPAWAPPDSTPLRRLLASAEEPGSAPQAPAPCTRPSHPGRSLGSLLRLSVLS